MRGAKVINIFTVMVEQEAENEVLLVEEVVHTLAVGAGYKMFACEHVGETVRDVAVIKRLRRDRHLLVEFVEDAIITVSGLDPAMENLKTVDTVHFARPLNTSIRKLNYLYSYENGDPIEMLHNRPSTWPAQRLVLASLFHQGIKPLKIPGGLKYAQAFAKDADGRNAETIIPAPPADTSKYNDIGDVHYFYIVPTSMLDYHIDMLPPEEGDERVTQKDTRNSLKHG